MLEILTAAEMKAAEAASGLSAAQMMQAAGTEAAKIIAAGLAPCPALVLCGPGNNGGDGFVVAQALKSAGWPVRIASTVKKTPLWPGEIEPLNSNLSVHQTGLVIDAVFGTGFNGSRALEPELAFLFEKIRARKIPVAAIDLPSGVDATTGTADPAALHADLTVTFHRKKIGHVLLPGAAYAGKVFVADIGLGETQANCLENSPALWLADFPRPRAEDHKYTRGHALVYGGAVRTGAACLAAAAAQKIGAGAVTIAAPDSARAIYATYRASIMVDACNDVDDFKALLRDERKNAIVLGPGAKTPHINSGREAPGAGADDKLRDSVKAAVAMNKSGVLDADALRDLPALSPKWVLTPHEGEFEKCFGVLEGSKLERARKAAKTANAILLLKGADTVIAAPDGKAVINAHAPATLATAGSGDVLAGLIAGLVAQGMPPFAAAAAAVWLHADAARHYGPGLTAEDIINMIPQSLNALLPSA